MLDEDILHEADVDEEIAEQVGEILGDPHAVIVDLAAITGGEAPTEAEHNAVRTRVNLLTQILRDAGLIATS
jgi:hypothetical protein